MFEKTPETVVQPRIPLIPVMAARNYVELVSKTTLLEKVSKLVIGGKQALLFAAS
jgi:hypothetical protein